MNIIDKLKEADLKGRSGSGFPTWVKWRSIIENEKEVKHIICNCSSGEPGIMKDEFIIKNHLEEVMDGIRIARDNIDAGKIIFYLRHDLYKKYGKKILNIGDDIGIEIFEKPGGYLCGEESVVINAIEKEELEPKIKPPFPTEVGLHNCPTLVNNIETFYFVSQISKGEYNNEKFFTVNGKVHVLDKDSTIKEILEKTNNYPKFDFWTQSGGQMCGEILDQDELDKPVCGPAGINTYNKKKLKPILFLHNWSKFLFRENCDKCIPCREGIYQVYQMTKTGKIDKNFLIDLADTLGNTSFCGLGKSSATFLRSFANKLL